MFQQCNDIILLTKKVKRHSFLQKKSIHKRCPSVVYRKPTKGPKAKKKVEEILYVNNIKGVSSAFNIPKQC